MMLPKRLMNLNSDQFLYKIYQNFFISYISQNHSVNFWGERRNAVSCIEIP